MNNSHSEQTSSCAVESKYFTPKLAMDESLSDFQETKKSCAGPKAKTGKSKSNKPKKPPKKIQGQKDIRKALRSRTNELEAYSKDFENVCKKAGIDVDSEQLQLAIALSKSLQDAASTPDAPSEITEKVNSQERIGKIRTTLQEYGFKVPEVKIAANTRKVRKHKKNFKLISTSDTEKKEIIANKYSQILFQDITHCSFYSFDLDVSNIPLYYLASNVTYDILKKTETFYVVNLIEKSMNTGNLLRDWAEIPGRPVSPKLFEPSNMNFSEIECSQDELEVVLSGSLKNCKNVISKKTKNLFSGNACKIVADDVNDSKIYTNSTNDHEKTLNVNNNSAENLMEPSSTAKHYRSCSPDIFDGDASSIFDNSNNMTVQEERNSPEVETLVTKTNIEIMDLTECVQNKPSQPLCAFEDPQSVFLNSNVTKRKSNDLMELTECIQIQSKDYCAITEKPLSQLSQNTNATKRRSNESMETNECVATLSQPKQYNIDLTQSSDFIEENTGKEINSQSLDVCPNTNSKPETSQNQVTYNKCNDTDLTVSSEHRDDKVETKHKSPETPKEVNPDKSIEESMDLTQSSSTSDELPIISLTTGKNISLDETIIVDINDYHNINKKSNLQPQPEIHIDLTQYSERLNETISNHSQSFFEEYNHSHSSNIEKPEQYDTDKVDLTQDANREPNNSQKSGRTNFNERCSNTHSQSKPGSGVPKQSLRKAPPSKYSSSDIIIEPVPVEYHSCNSGYKLRKSGNVNLTLSPIKQSNDDDKNNDNLDLTQNSDTSEEMSQNLSKYDSSNDFNTHVSAEKNELATAEDSQRCSILGKIDDVSIDYDEFLNTEAKNKTDSSRSISSKSVIYEIDENPQKSSKNNSFISNCSQHSEVFDISDNELNYSLHQSKLEMPKGNFAFGGISIMDELSDVGASKKSIDVDNHSIASNNLNDVEGEILPLSNIKNAKKDTNCKEISPIKHRRITEIATPQKACSSNIVTVVTPKNSELLIKTNNVTPMLDYESMSTPEIHNELDKYGIKPFKRKRAIQLLTHIYNQTHPIIEIYADELASPPKRFKPNDDQPTTSPRKRISPRKLLRSPRKDLEINKGNANDNVNKNPITNKGKDKKTKVPENDIGKENKKKNGKGRDNSGNQNNGVTERIDSNSTRFTQSSSNEANFEATNEAPIIRDIECKPEDWVFQKREKAKLHSCRVPLHIAFHNYVSSRRHLREAILCYEPVEIDIIHKDLVAYGHRYDPKDLLKFLDKKCITVKTTDNDARNNKR